jgi:hypothetical protein
VASFRRVRAAIVILLLLGATSASAARGRGRAPAGRPARITIVPGGRMSRAQVRRAHQRSALREMLHAGEVGWVRRTVRFHDAEGRRLDRSAAIEGALARGTVTVQRHDAGRPVGERTPLRSMSALAGWHRDVGAAWLRSNRGYHLLQSHD